MVVFTGLDTITRPPHMCDTPCDTSPVVPSILDFPGSDGGRETPANNAIVLSPLVGRRPALGLGEALSQVVRLRGRRGRSLS